ncbi:helix-turn-helix domain-containing protein [Saccharothrix sp.]|uniref:winged helix-turn-helix transcriptional regulator n=1 Tax=Saccharothrix sp. TaxID=1873460 RepID=UPI0028124A68|nr:helix-turn-helix domain-containing protein [Saccharothrix sp.]
MAVRRVRFEEAGCPVSRSVDAVGDWWSLLIVRDAFDGLRRLSDFQRSLGVAKNMLSARLRELVAHGVLMSVPSPDGGFQREYVLTAKGRDLFPVIVALRQWGERHCFVPGEPHTTLVDRVTGRPVAMLEVRAESGAVLGPDDTVVTGVS